MATKPVAAGSQGGLTQGKKSFINARLSELRIYREKNKTSLDTLGPSSFPPINNSTLKANSKTFVISIIRLETCFLPPTRRALLS